MDNLGLTAENMDAIRVRTKEADIILKHANMSVKKWCTLEVMWISRKKIR